jgi:SET domain-containing protein
MNHSYTPNAVYIRRFAERAIEFFALREIRAGEEVRVNYTGSPEGRGPLWFPVTE